MLITQEGKLEVQKFNEVKEKLLRFCQNCDHIFLYGAGKYGKACFSFLQQHFISIEGFLDTYKHDMEYQGKPIYLASDTTPLSRQKTGIILSLKNSFQSEIKRNFVSKPNVALLEVEDWFFQYLGIFDMLQSFDRINAGEGPQKGITDADQWRKILVVRLDAIGDLVWTTAFFRELKRNFPKAQVTVVVRPIVASLVETCPYIDKVLLYDCPLEEGSLTRQRELRAKSFSQKFLLKEHYDAVFLPRPLPRAAEDGLDNILLALYSGAKYRIGRADYVEFVEKIIADAMENFFSVIIKHEEVEHEVSRILKLVEMCGGTIEAKQLELWLTASDEDFALTTLPLKKADVPVLIAVAIESNERKRSWDVFNYIHLIENMAQKYGAKVQFILLGGASAIPIGNTIHTIEKYFLGNNVLNLIDKTTLTQAAAVIKHCDLYLGSNTGLLHMASTFQTPVLEISSHSCDEVETKPSNPARIGAWHTYHKVIQPHGFDKDFPDCTQIGVYAINQITVEEVQSELETMIQYVLAEGC